MRTHLSRLINSGTVRSENACNSTRSEAVQTSYVRGDEDMAGNANRLAGEIPRPPPRRGQRRRRTVSAGNLPVLPDTGAVRNDAAAIDASGQRAKGYGQDLVAAL